MKLVHTISGVDNDGTIWDVEIYTVQKLPNDRGIWDIETNRVVITEKMYSYFVGCTQDQKSKFFDGLLRISNYQLSNAG